LYVSPVPFEIRDARDSDAPGIVSLLTELGHAATEAEVWGGIGYREEGVRFAKEVSGGSKMKP
jgi:hypothetical protein